MNTNMTQIARSIRLLAGVSLAIAASAAHAQSSLLVVLHNFGEAGADPAPVKDLVAAADGTFYGLDGNYGSGVFRMTASGVVSDVAAIGYEVQCPTVYNYCFQGLGPASLIQGADGNLYAGTFGVYENENIVDLSPTGSWTMIGAALASIAAPLVQAANGTFYGVSVDNVFSQVPNGLNTTLHTFSKLDASGHNTDGYYPLGGLALGPDGSYYGTTSQGGANGLGTIFKITTTGTFTKLHDFSQATGGEPKASLTLAEDGNFYGTAYSGGTYGNGVVFRLTPAGVYSVVHSFISSEGIGPASHLVESDRGTTQYLYGTTVAGGANNTGVLYSITPTGKFAVQHSFASVLNRINTDGVSPNGLAVGHDGDLYGTAVGGGAYGYGTAFELITQDPTMMLKIRPATVSVNQQATLTWNSTSTTSCLAKGAWSGNEAPSGTQVVSQAVKGSYNYKLECSGPYGSLSKTVTLTVK